MEKFQFGIVALICVVSLVINFITAFKKVKTDKSQNKTTDIPQLVMDFSEKVLNSLVSANDILKAKVSDFKTIEEYKAKIISIATESLIDELKADGLYTDDLNTISVENLISFGLSKFGDLIEKTYYDKQEEAKLKEAEDSTVPEPETKAVSIEENPLIDSSDTSANTEVKSEEPMQNITIAEPDETQPKVTSNDEVKDETPTNQTEASSIVTTEDSVKDDNTDKK